MSALDVSQLNVSYDKTPVLWDITLKIPTGVLVGVIGPNGAGKSTLIKTALGLVKPLSGSVRFFGKPLSVVQRRVGYVPQRESVDWDFPITALELVLMGCYGRLGLFKRPKKKDVTLAKAVLKQVSMLQYANRQISELSGGQQQRLFIARALLQDCDLYFMDEPFAGIDVASEKVIMDLLRSLIDRGKTIVVVHHDLSSVRNYFDWVILLNMRLVSCGPTDVAFTQEMLESAYGKSHGLFDEVARLSQSKSEGFT